MTALPAPDYDADATYSPEDNKIRLYVAVRLDADTYERAKAAGFRWAPKQDLFFATWSPPAEDFALELAGEIGDEDTSLTDRAEERADRFEGYRANRTKDAEQARKAVAAIAEHIPMGQPILVGHHSERRARKDAERIDNGMRRAVKMWDTAKYWTDRAAGALRHAKYKERPDVRARRIKTIEADQRRNERQRDKAFTTRSAWERLTSHAQAVDYCRRRAVYIRLDGKDQNAAAALEANRITWDALRTRTLDTYDRLLAAYRRWSDHYAARLTYERTLLDASGYTPPPKPKTSAALPLLNVPGVVAYRNMYRAGEIVQGEAVSLTRAEYSAINKDYKGTRVSEDGTHRLRTAMLNRNGGRGLYVVFLTDSKQHATPSPAAVEQVAEAEADARTEALAARLATAAPKPTPAPDPQAEMFTAMKATLRAGVQTVSAPQLFPTPPDLARRMAELADVQPGERILEPSAGTGNLIQAALDRVTGADCLRVVAVEINPTVAANLEARRNRTVYANEDRYAVVCADFLTCEPHPPKAPDSHPLGTRVFGLFDRILMNPPFSKGADVAHIRHALTFLKPGGRLVALCANGPRQAAALQPIADTWDDLPAGTFAGTNVRAVLLTMTGV